MTASDSARNFLVSVLGFIRERKLLVAAIAVVLGIGLSWLIHLPTGYSGHAHPSQAISTDFSSGFSVAWEMTSKDLGVDGPIAATTRVDGVLVAVTGKKDGSSKGATTSSGTLIGIDPSGSTPTVLWRHEFNSESDTLFTWDDSIIAGGETIRASDGTVTATWDSPLPTTVGYDHDLGSPRVLSPSRPSWGDGASFVPITSSVVVTCTSIDDSRSGDRDEGPSCTGWHKDGTQAWNYAVTRNADRLTVQPTGVATVDDHLIVGHYEKNYDLYVDSFLSLVDGSVTDLGVAFSGRLSIDNVYATSDGWIINGMSYSQLEDDDIAVLNPDGSLRETMALTTNSLSWRTLITTTCTDTDGQAVQPTTEQALAALRTGHGWTPMCSNVVTSGSGSSIYALNGRWFLAADEDGTPTYTEYEQGSFFSTDGSLILSVPKKSVVKDFDKDNIPTLHFTRSGKQVASLSQVGARSAQPFYDDLLIATPVPKRNIFLRYLGGYPHPDTVLMGITPRRAS
ncbi:MAG: hypothetical protein HXK10_03830 [Actinomyces sp.]|uniref:hypothetical protein n=2 Tax=Actinomycetaceae TaxID=2049 RepID=UPI001CB329B2|nr:hypothetical protein [Schaalia sp. HMT-172]MBF0959239.1 hypothetical protein [Actinomyces sp.]WLD78253.1 hypothetical protein QU663_01105 [Schaalia sp. HMT-172]